MLHWKFQTYVAASGRTDVQDDVDRLDTFGSELFQRQVRHLAVSNIAHWHEPQAKKLKGSFDPPIYEVRFKANNRAMRAIGYFGPGPNDFTITLICYHKGNVYTPKDALQTACRRAGEVRAGAASTSSLQIDGEDLSQDEE